MKHKPPALLKAVVLLSLLLLNGCGFNQFWLLRPAGPIAGEGLRSIIVDVSAMMLIIGPTTLLLLWCIWRYRRSTGRGNYVPGWSHSLPIEIVSWGFPLAIVAFLSYYSYRSTFRVDPFDPGLMKPGQDAETDRPPIDIDVVTTDWQWLFIYPDRHIAVSNQLVVPVHTPIRFRLTSATVPNDFYIPQLSGEIDIMPGMLTKQGLIANRAGSYQGIAADFSGPGFSWMQFETRVVSRAAYEQWANDTAKAPAHLDQAAFDRFAIPTINKTGNVLTFSQVDDRLFERVIQNVMMGRIYPTPPNMTEKKSSYQNGRRQPDKASTESQTPTGMSD